jgi:hypothetical protein
MLNRVPSGSAAPPTATRAERGRYVRVASRTGLDLAIFRERRFPGGIYHRPCHAACARAGSLYEWRHSARNDGDLR